MEIFLLRASRLKKKRKKLAEKEENTQFRKYKHLFNNVITF